MTKRDKTDFTKPTKGIGQNKAENSERSTQDIIPMQGKIGANITANTTKRERCKLDKPDCFNCPYPECYANSKDIQRQWRMGFKETTDEFLRDALYDRRA